MKKVILSLLLCFIGIGLFGQSYSFKTYAFCAGERNSQGYITWDDWVQSDVNITIRDTEYSSRVTIYSNHIQSYFCRGRGTGSLEGDGISYNATDEEGLACIIKLYRNCGGETELYVFWRNVAIAYKIEYNE